MEADDRRDVCGNEQEEAQ